MARVDIPAPFTGSVWQHAVSEGQVVAEGIDLMTVEACKLEVPIISPCCGTVIWLKPMGETFQEGESVATIDDGT